MAATPCPAGPGCVRKQFAARVFLGKRNTEPPPNRYMALLDDKGVEVSGPSYRRQPVTFRRTDNKYVNVAEVRFKVKHVYSGGDPDEVWRVYQAALKFSEEPGADCMCQVWRMKKRIDHESTPGDTHLWEPGCLRVTLGGTPTSWDSEYSLEMFGNFMLLGEEPPGPSGIYMGLLGPEPSGGYAELSAPGYQRKRMAFKWLTDGLTPQLKNDVMFDPSGPWRVSAFGIFDGPGPEAHVWHRLPFWFGVKTFRPGEPLGFLKGQLTIR